jgi:putative membrane protein
MTAVSQIVAAKSGTGTAIAAILAISASASPFLFWLIYVHPAAASSTQYAFLPAQNALFNGLVGSVANNVDGMREVYRGQ